ncbi:MAG: DNA adenine methylase [Candidatus Marsarchaeota archaeon]|nr:DNA adenine methylase [Candidatus Marsarchaeota archaeon]
MKPIIKWAGGKSSEIKYIEKIIPKKFDRYFEPFFGGGALFFHLQPTDAVINDRSQELMLIYKLLCNGEQREVFKKELYYYVKYWERINEYMANFGDKFLDLYNKYKRNQIDDIELENRIVKLFNGEILAFNGLFHNKFCLDRDNMLKTMQKNVIAKLKHIKKDLDSENNFSNDSIKQNIETAFRSGFYIHFREMMNRSKRGLIGIPDEKKVANYYFVREFCYGGMFRFNDSGDFNVPYGGMNYNNKDFRNKVDRLFSDDVRQVLSNAKIENLDFEKIFEKYKPTGNDFVFLDPPYDTEFSEYEENPFTREDQERLANIVINLKAKFVLIIKSTPFILNLYKRKRGIKILSFGKTYIYNIKGRNEREVKHLVIHNLDVKQNQKKLITALAV